MPIIFLWRRIESPLSCEGLLNVSEAFPRLHIVVTLRLSDVKARDKLLPLLKSSLVHKVTLVRYASVALESEKLTQVIYDLGTGEKPSWWIGLRNAWAALRAMRRVARRDAPDVFLGFYLFPHGLIAWLAARLAGKRAVVSLIGSDFNRNLNTPALGTALRFMLRRFDAVVVFGDHARQELVASGVAAHRVFTLPNTANTETFRPDAGVKPDVDLIYVGALLQFKRVDLLLHALKIARESRPQTNALIVGDGAERRHLEDLARSLGVDVAVEFCGYANQVVDLLRRARVFVLLSEHEGLPMAVIEAMCTGLPVVVTDVGALSSVVQDSLNGYLIPSPADPGLVADRLLRLLNDPAHYERLSGAALRVRETHGYERGAQVWDEILASLS